MRMRVVGKGRSEDDGERDKGGEEVERELGGLMCGGGGCGRC